MLLCGPARNVEDNLKERTKGISVGRLLNQELPLELLGEIAKWRLGGSCDKAAGKEELM